MVMSNGGHPSEVYVEEPPEERRHFGRWLVLVVLLLAAIAGGVAYFATRDRTHTYQVPHACRIDRGGGAEPDLRIRLGHGGHPRVQRGGSQGIVIRTEPGEATRLEQNKPFALYVSTGPAPRPLPELVGLTLDQATAALTHSASCCSRVIRFSTRPCRRAPSSVGWCPISRG